MTQIAMAGGSALGTALRQSRWIGPALLSAHLTGVAALAATVAVVDLRLLGAWRRVPVRRFVRRLLPWTAASFLLIVPSGLTMFARHAGELINSGVFALKMGLIMGAGVNAAIFHTGVFRGAAAWDVGAMPPPAARLAGALSLALWASVIACGLSLPVD